MPRKATAEASETALTQAQPIAGDHPMAVLERLAQADVSVEKIERLVALAERAEIRNAERAFNEAMNAAQKEMEPVSKDAANPETHSRYASYPALDRAIRPIYTRHGFALSFDSGEAKTDEVLMLCYVTHTGGFTRVYRLLVPADGKGPKGGAVMTRTHATGSGVAYGKRYLLGMIFNIATDNDDDGRKAGRRKAQPLDPVASHPDEDAPITPAQVTRLWTIARRIGRTDAEMARYLEGRWGVQSSKEIRRRDYEAICQAIEAPGPLSVREPGEDG